MEKPSLDAIILHYTLRDKKYMLELSKAVKPAYFLGPFQEFYNVIHTVFIDPRIKEVLSLPAFLDYCDNNELGSNRDRFRKIYEHAEGLRVEGMQLAEGDFTYFLKQLKERYNALVVRSAVSNISSSIKEGSTLPDVNDVFEQTVRDINAIYVGEVFDEGTVGEDAINMLEEHRFISESPESFQGVMSGFVQLDSLTNGFFGGELIIVAGFEGTGKSLLCMNMAVNAWLGSNSLAEHEGQFVDDGKNIVYFSLEMPRSNRGEFSSAAYLNKRVISCVAGVPFTDLRKGELIDDELKRFEKSCKFIHEYDQHKKFYVVDIPRGATIADIETKYLELQDSFDIDMVVIDYIGLMSGAEDEADWESQGKLAEGLHTFARMYNVPVVSPVQVNRPSGSNHSLNKQSYNTTRIARSGMITQNANIVLQIGCRDQEHEYVDMPLHIVKMRDGARDVLTLTKDFGNMRVLDCGEDDDSLNVLGVFEDIGGANE